jgi:hypothetical protein
MRRVLDKLIVAQLVMKFLAFYGIQRLITVYTRARTKSEVLCNIS